MRQWRLIYDTPAAGAWNMAVDEAIMESVAAGVVPPTLRLYAWTPACLSLGYGQRAADVDFTGAYEQGWDVVRRPTGGRAILHTDELTYSLSLPADDPLAAGSIVESYRRISAALLVALEQLGAAPRANQQAARVEAGPVCFEVPSHYEITVDGRKLVGSAQLRRKNAVLQHGSLPLAGDMGRICAALAFATESERALAVQQVRQRALTLYEALGYEVSWGDAADSVVRAFAAVYAVEFGDYEPVLTADEVQRARQLHDTVYTHPTWTTRR